MEEKTKFKDQWNLFQIQCYRLIQKHFNEDEEAMDQFQRQLSSIKTNEERIKYVLKNEPFSKALEEHVNYLFEAPKENDCGCKIYCFGNDEEQANEIDSISNQMSVLLCKGCQTDDGNLSQLAKRRAKIFYLLNRFAECVDEIIEFKIADDELLAIKIECMAALCQTENVRSDLIETDVENEQLNGASNSIVMEIDETKGRLIKSIAKIKKRTIVIEEIAYAHWLRPTLYHLYCYACLKKLNYRYFYCGQCLKVLFCSLKCLKTAMNTFHKQECKYIDTIRHFAMGHFALRMVSIEGIDRVIETAKKGNIDLQFAEFSNNYESIYSLIGDNYLRDSTLFLSACVSGAVLALSVDRMSWISRDSSDFYLLAGVLFKHMMQVLVNTFVIYDCQITENDLKNIDSSLFSRKRKKVGVGLYSTSSLLSHSCDNNCIKVFNGSKIIIISLRSINEGEEVTINYGVTSNTNSDLKERKEFLFGNFGFNCKCEICEAQVAFSV